MAVAFDTHQYVKEFQRVGVPEEQAELTVKMFSEVLEKREQVYKQNLSSKQDVKDVENNLRQEISLVRQELKEEISLVRQELREEISLVRQDISNFKGEIFKWGAGLLLGQAGLIVALVKIL